MKESPSGRRPNIIFVTQVIDPDDPIFGSVVGSLRALGRHCNRLAVIANEVRTPTEGPRLSGVEVYSLKNRGIGKLRTGMRYEALLYRAIRSLPADAVIAHMCPIYLVLAKPLSAAFGVSTLLWYAHPANTRQLAMAERWADLVVTSLDGTYPRESPKVRIIGQAVDVEVFHPADTEPGDGPLRLLALGRTGLVKGYRTAIEGVCRAAANGAAVQLRIIGPSTTPAEKAHREDLRRFITARGAEGLVTLEHELPASAVPALLRDCDALLNTTVSGSGDRVVFEAMASAKPVIASNRNFASLLDGLPLELRFPEGNAEMLGERLTALAGAEPAARRGTGLELRRRVQNAHSVDHWATALTDLVADLRSNGGRSTGPSKPAARAVDKHGVVPADSRPRSG